MRAGKLNRQITFQALTRTTDSGGFPTESWADSTTVWAQVISSGGGEFFAAQKLNAETSVVFKVRHLDVLDTGNVSKDYRVKFGTRYFDILNINPVDGMRVEMMVSCKEIL